MSWRELADLVVPPEALRGVRTAPAPWVPPEIKPGDYAVPVLLAPAALEEALRGAVRALQKVDGEVGLLPAEKAALEAAEATLGGGASWAG
jgi:hypothetical protein